MEQFDFLHNGSLYSCDNDELAKGQTKCLAKLSARSVSVIKPIIIRI